LLSIWQKFNNKKIARLANYIFPWLFLGQKEGKLFKK
jgi:hypothetical protein